MPVDLDLAVNLRNVKVHLIVGPQGVGKTGMAYSIANELGEELYTVPLPKSRSRPLWFDDYDGQKVILLDNFKGEKQIGIVELMRIVDSYPLRCEKLGGVVHAMWTTVIITTQLEPNELFKETIEATPFAGVALWRRIPRESLTHMLFPNVTIETKMEGDF